VKDVEDRIRDVVHGKRVRITEYFKDYDRLRTGFITKTQFDRCLDQQFGIVLSNEEDCQLMSKYGSDPKQRDRVNYREFCNTLCANFNPNILDIEPATQRIGSASSFPAECRPLSPSSLAKCNDVLQRIAPYYKYHGIIVKNCFEDFDRHNNGLVTESQFYRSLPGPPDVSESEMMLLAKKYLDPTKPSLCSYMKLHNDILEVQKGMEDNFKYPGRDEVVGGDEHMPMGGTGSDLQHTFEKIRLAVVKNGLRTTEFFKDHDKLRSGIITENQFICGMSLCCGTAANLSRDEIQQLANYYRTEDGRVCYREFCQVMENAFNVSDLEKKPTVDVYRPPRGSLYRICNQLSAAEEREVQDILQDLANQVRKRRLMAYPYFKDFDRSTGYTRGVTKPQFSRMLHFLSLNLQPKQMDLICRKFEDPVGGDVNYPAFIQAIDTEYVGNAAIKEEQKESAPPPSPPKIDLSTVDLDELLCRIKHDVLVNRLRVEEYFQDFDPLRSGSITFSQFRRGLSLLGQCDLTEAQFLVLAKYYADPDPKRPGNVLWTRFQNDVEVVFTQRGLEQVPTYKVPSMEVFEMSKEGTRAITSLPSQTQDRLGQIMHFMRERANQRRVLAKPCFQDFDKHNNGHVTRSQFKQCLLYIGFNVTEEDMKVLEETYSDNVGFNYVRFLQDLQPKEPEENRYPERLEELKTVNNKQMPDSGSSDLDMIMFKIKTKVVKERIRVLEFMKDHDKLRTGRLLKSLFPRTLDLCNLGLTKREVEVLMYRYESIGFPDYVDYLHFSDDIESVFTVKGLEKNPLYEPKQFHAHLEEDKTKLGNEEEFMLNSVMHRLADRVRLRRIQILPLFGDYDRVHNGSVSRSQFRRVLSELELGSLVSTREFQVLYKKYDVLIGGKHDFNYILFCAQISDLCNQ